MEALQRVKLDGMEMAGSGARLPEAGEALLGGVWAAVAAVSAVWYYLVAPVVF
jgi:hypothetical protein